MKMYVRVDMNIINLINEKYKGNISLAFAENEMRDVTHGTH